MKILGLDLSLTSTGVATPLGETKRLRVRLVGVERLVELRDLVMAEAACGFEDGPVDLVAIEGYSMGGQRGSAGVGQALGELGGVVRVALFEDGFPYVEIPPSCLKKYATGKGNASKEEVLVEAVKRLGYEGASNDEADALWLRQMALDAYGHAVIQVPAAHRTGLAGVSWPELAYHQASA